MIKLTRIGIDLAKNVFQLHGVDRTGMCVFKRRFSRSQWVKQLVEQIEPGCEIGMEACGGCPSLGAGHTTAWIYGETHRPAVCKTVCKK